VFRRLVPGAAGRDHVTLHGGGHFLQEEVGRQLAGRGQSCCRDTLLT
jgi:haloalkane dehalogenase